MPIFETQCKECSLEHEALIKTSEPDVAHCPRCDKDTKHKKLPALCRPAKYLGEVPHNPRVFGGKFDTAGAQRQPDLPEVEPYEKRWSDRSNRYVDVYKADQLMEVANRPETKEIKAERKEIAKRNRAKRKRDAAINRGENINFGRQSHDRLPGDPNFKL